jgi:AraC-like DNA-binding protein
VPSGNARPEKIPSAMIEPARAAGEESYLYRFEDLKGLELLSADYQNHAFLPHWHDALMVSAVVRGGQRIRYRSREFALTPGKIMFLGPQEIHDGETLAQGAPWLFRVMYLDVGLIEEISTGLIDRLSKRPAIQAEHHLWSQFLEAHAVIRQSSNALERAATLSLFLERVTEQSGLATALDRPLPSRKLALERAREYIQVHFTDAIDLAELAAIARISRYHLLRSFRERYALTPHAYQTQLRVHHAKELLFQGMPAKDAAIESGFYDQAHMTTTLRRYVGATPGRLRIFPENGIATSSKTRPGHAS